MAFEDTVEEIENLRGGKGRKKVKVKEKNPGTKDPLNLGHYAKN